jgi:hypothetical protein
MCLGGRAFLVTRACDPADVALTKGDKSAAVGVTPAAGLGTTEAGLPRQPMPA